MASSRTVFGDLAPFQAKLLTVSAPRRTRREHGRLTVSTALMARWWSPIRQAVNTRRRRSAAQRNGAALRVGETAPPRDRRQGDPAARNFDASKTLSSRAQRGTFPVALKVPRPSASG